MTACSKPSSWREGCQLTPGRNTSCCRQPIQFDRGRSAVAVPVAVQPIPWNNTAAAAQSSANPGEGGAKRPARGVGVEVFVRHGLRRSPLPAARSPAQKAQIAQRADGSTSAISRSVVKEHWRSQTDCLRLHLTMWRGRASTSVVAVARGVIDVHLSAGTCFLVSESPIQHSGNLRQPSSQVQPGSRRCGLAGPDPSEIGARI
jgi:hypothetical protein